MPRPTYSDVHRNTPLTNISIAHAQANAGKYKARAIFPSVGVQKKSDKYYIYDKGDLLRSQAARRGPSAEIAIGSYGISDEPYECENWALGRDIDDPTRSNADPQFDLDAEASEFLTDQIEQALEGEWTGDFFRTGVWDGASSSTDMTGQAAPASTATNFRQWNDLASTPIEDIRGEMTHVAGRTGYRPNKLVLGALVWPALADHPDLLDRIKYTQMGSVGPGLLASLLGLDEVVILDSVVNPEIEGRPEQTFYRAGRHAFLCYTTPAPGLRRPTAGYTFVWTGHGIPLVGAAVSRYRLERNRSDRIEAETWVDFKRVSSELGAFFANAVAG